MIDLDDANRAAFAIWLTRYGKPLLAGKCLEIFDELRGRGEVEASRLDIVEAAKDQLDPDRHSGAVALAAATIHAQLRVAD